MIEWFTRNTVTANLLMVVILVAGVIGAFDVREEMIPEFELDRINIQVAYLGAAPAEVESAVCIRIEEAVQGIDGIKTITSTTSGSGHPNGGAVPFSLVAVTEPGRGSASVKRVDRNRAVNVTAAINAGVTSSGQLVADLETNILPAVLARHPGVTYSFEGIQTEQQDAVGELQIGFATALLAIFALLAISLKSYLQPLIIMGAIPFGLVSAVWGHMLLGPDVTLMSMFGLVALSGVVVNDSLVMVAFINKHRSAHEDLGTATREAGASRFRPILLTSLTTFVGLVPLMFDQSFEAAFMVPMAISLAFGVLFATFITLILVPTSYPILADAERAVAGLFGRTTSGDPAMPGLPQ